MPARARGRKEPRASVPSPELAICGRIWRDGKLQSAEIGLDDQGDIVRVAKDVRAPRRHDVGQAVILPAAVDLHVHFREPGPPGAVENLNSGTVQAAFGGVGAVGDMPNTSPPVVSVDDVREKAARAKGRIAVDLFVYALLSERTAIERVARVAGAFKLYMSPTTGVSPPPDPPVLAELLRRLAATGSALTVHAEDPHAFRSSEAVVDAPSWDAARPPAAEEQAIRILSGSPAGLRVHFAHTTTAEALTLIRNHGWSAEATPHHLLLSSSGAPDARWKVNPPLRSAAEQRTLWERFCHGEITSLATDHAPHSMESKRAPWSEAPSGMPGVETGLPLMLARVRSGELSLGALVEAACERPARWIGLPMGRVMPGHRGHLIVVDFKRPSRVESARLHAPCGWNAFEGYPAVFPVEHYHRGALILDHGEYVGGMAGAVVRPDFAPDGLSSTPEGI